MTNQKSNLMFQLDAPRGSGHIMVSGIALSDFFRVDMEMQEIFSE
jgi:hypothetical protein